MSVSADISLMDILFDRDDPVLKFVDDRDVFKHEVDGIDAKTDLLNDKVPGSYLNFFYTAKVYIFLTTFLLVGCLGCGYR